MANREPVVIAAVVAAVWVILLRRERVPQHTSILTGQLYYNEIIEHNHRVRSHILCTSSIMSVCPSVLPFVYPSVGPSVCHTCGQPRPRATKNEVWSHVFRTSSIMDFPFLIEAQKRNIAIFRVRFFKNLNLSSPKHVI